MHIESVADLGFRPSGNVLEISGNEIEKTLNFSNIIINFPNFFRPRGSGRHPLTTYMSAPV
ncbi:hypothetical protein Hanom_Chr04g00286921 [Helianthus anomalus]